jgi:hypothetical protein
MLVVIGVLAVTGVLVMSRMPTVAVANHGVLFVISHGSLYIGIVICMVRWGE